MKSLKVSAFSIIVLLMAVIPAFAQVEGDALKNLIKDQEYVFIPQNAMTQRGTTIYLTSEYELKIGKVEIESYLPFFGRAFSAPMNSTDGGIKFISRNFKYKEKIRKKGGWDINIVPQDTRDVNSLNLSIGENGYATLNVNSNQRANMAFYGYIKKKEEKKTEN